MPLRLRLALLLCTNTWDWFCLHDFVSSFQQPVFINNMSPISMDIVELAYFFYFLSLILQMYQITEPNLMDPLQYLVVVESQCHLASLSQVYHLSLCLSFHLSVYFLYLYAWYPLWWDSTFLYDLAPNIDSKVFLSSISLELVDIFDQVKYCIAIKVKQIFVEVLFALS